MGRFYQTSQVQYLPNLAYQAPIELMMQKINQDNQIRQNATQLAQQLEVANHSQQYYDDPYGIERQRLLEQQQYFDNKINDIVNQIYNSTDYSKLRQAQSDVSRELTESMRTGELSKIANRYAAYSNLMKDYQQAAEKDKFTADQVLNWELQQLNKAVYDDSINYNPNKIITKPQIQKELNDMVKLMKANKTFQSSNGYLISTEYLDENRLYELALNELQSRPEYASYVQQGARIGMPGIIDENGNVIQPYAIYDRIGNEISLEEFQDANKQSLEYQKIIQNKNATKEEKETATQKLLELQQRGYHQGINKRWLFHNDIARMNSFAYRQEDVKGDPVYLQKMAQQHDFAKMAQQHLYNIEKEKLKQANRLELERMKSNGKKTSSSSSNSSNNLLVAQGFDPIVNESGEPFKQITTLSTSQIDYDTQPQTNYEINQYKQLQNSTKDDIINFYDNLSKKEKWKSNKFLLEFIEKQKNKIQDPNFIINNESVTALQQELYDKIKENNERIIEPFETVTSNSVITYSNPADVYNKVSFFSFANPNIFGKIFNTDQVSYNFVETHKDIYPELQGMIHLNSFKRMMENDFEEIMKENVENIRNQTLVPIATTIQRNEVNVKEISDLLSSNSQQAIQYYLQDTDGNVYSKVDKNDKKIYDQVIRKLQDPDSGMRLGAVEVMNDNYMYVVTDNEGISYNIFARDVHAQNKMNKDCQASLEFVLEQLNEEEQLKMSLNAQSNLSDLNYELSTKRKGETITNENNQALINFVNNTYGGMDITRAYVEINTNNDGTHNVTGYYTDNILKKNVEISFSSLTAEQFNHLPFNMRQKVEENRITATQEAQQNNKTN